MPRTCKKQVVDSNVLEDKLLEDLASKVLQEWIDPTDLLRPLLGWIMNKVLEKEMEIYLWHKKYERWNVKTNYRNWFYQRTVKSDHWNIEIDMPRDRNWKFESIILPKYKTTLWKIQNIIIELYSRWVSIFDIKEHLYEIYWLVLSETQISELIDDIMDEVDKRKNRQLEKAYPILYIDAIHMNVKREWMVKKIAVYLVLGYNIRGEKELLGLYILWDNESARDWLTVLNDLKNRWVEKVGIIVSDNLKWISEAIRWAFPETEIQKCIVHQVRNSLNKVSWKHRKELAKDMKKIYTAPNEEEAEKRLAEFSEKWKDKAPLAVISWQKNWDELKTFLKYPEEIRRLIYTTNPIESLNSQLRKYSKTKRVLPNEESALKILYLAIWNISKRWTQPLSNWGRILYQINIYMNGLFDEYIT